MLSPQTHRFTLYFWQIRRVNTLHTAESAQFYSAFSPTTISLTPRFRWKRKFWLHFFAEKVQNDPKTCSCEDNAKFNSAFSVTMLSYTTRFRRKKRGVIQNFEYLGEFEEDLRRSKFYCVLYLLVIEKCKKRFKNRLWKSRACVPLNWQLFHIWVKLVITSSLVHLCYVPTWLHYILYLTRPCMVGSNTSCLAASAVNTEKHDQHVPAPKPDWGDNINLFFFYIFYVSSSTELFCVH